MPDTPFKVFISWSGDLSKQVATVWHSLIEDLFDGVKPFMSEENIGAGARGLNLIATELSGSTFGIIVVTQQNLNSQWLNYEAGALSKDVNDETAMVAPCLVDFARKGDAEGPIGQFQGNLLTEVGVQKIVTALAKAVGVKEETALKRLKTYWNSTYKDEFDKARIIDGHVSEPVTRDPAAVLDEILTIVREIRRPIELPVLSGGVSVRHLLESSLTNDLNNTRILSKRATSAQLKRYAKTAAGILGMVNDDLPINSISFPLTPEGEHYLHLDVSEPITAHDAVRIGDGVRSIMDMDFNWTLTENGDDD